MTVKCESEFQGVSKREPYVCRVVCLCYVWRSIVNGRTHWQVRVAMRGRKRSAINAARALMETVCRIDTGRKLLRVDF